VSALSESKNRAAYVSKPQIRAAARAGETRHARPAAWCSYKKCGALQSLEQPESTRVFSALPRQK